MSESNMSLMGKRLIVIGGATGIGFAIAELAAQQGASVVIASTNEANVAAAVARLQNATGRSVDLRDEGSVSRFFAEVGAFDHLAITAGDWGGSMFVPTKDLDLTATQALLGVRFWGVIAAIKYGSQKIAVDGSITLTSGMLLHRPMKGAPMTAAIAGAIEGLVRGFAADLAPIRVNVVCPGLILTDPVKQMPEEAIQSMVAHQPLPRTGTPLEAAKAYVYLMLNGYATGQSLTVDGGGILV